MDDSEKPIIHRNRLTLKDKMVVLKNIEEDRSNGMPIAHACKKHGIHCSCYYLWKKYVKEKAKEEKIVDLYNSKSDQAGCVPELRYLEKDILSFIAKKREMGLTVTTRMIVDFVKTKEERFREKTERAQVSQIHRFLKAQNILSPTQARESQKQKKLVEESAQNFMEENKEILFSDNAGQNRAATRKTKKKDQDEEEGYDSSDRNKVNKSKRGTNKRKRVSSTSSNDKISSATSGGQKNNPDKDEERRTLLEEVRVNTELLHKFEGIIPKEDLDKRKRALFLALPPVPLPNMERITSAAAKDVGSAEPDASKIKGQQTFKSMSRKHQREKRSRRR